MFRRHHALSALTVVAFVGVSTVGCSEDEQATPKVTFTSEITSGSHPSADCRETGPGLNIGSFGNVSTGEKVQPVDDGGSFGQGNASVTCSVTGSGDGFNVKATATLTGAQGGSVTIEGFFRPTGDNPDIAMTFSAFNKATYTTRKCTVKYTEQLQTTAAGRVWGVFDCPEVRNDQQQRVCAATGQLRFENCAQ